MILDYGNIFLARKFLYWHLYCFFSICIFFSELIVLNWHIFNFSAPIFFSWFRINLIGSIVLRMILVLFSSARVRLLIHVEIRQKCREQNWCRNVENVKSKIGVEMSKNVVSKMTRHIDMSFSKMSRNVEILLITAVVTFI